MTAIIYDIVTFDRPRTSRMSSDTTLVARSSTSEYSCSRMLPRGAMPGAACFIGQLEVDSGLSTRAFSVLRDDRRRIIRLIASIRAVAVSNDTGKRSILGPTKYKRDNWVMPNGTARTARSSDELFPRFAEHIFPLMLGFQRMS